MAVSRWLNTHGCRVVRNVCPSSLKAFGLTSQKRTYGQTDGGHEAMEKDPSQQQQQQQNKEIHPLAVSKSGVRIEHKTWCAVICRMKTATEKMKAKLSFHFLFLPLEFSSLHIDGPKARVETRAPPSAERNASIQLNALQNQINRLERKLRNLTIKVETLSLNHSVNCADRNCQTDWLTLFKHDWPTDNPINRSTSCMNCLTT